MVLGWLSGSSLFSPLECCDAWTDAAINDSIDHVLGINNISDGQIPTIGQF